MINIESLGLDMKPFWNTGKVIFLKYGNDLRRVDSSKVINADDKYSIRADGKEIICSMQDLLNHDIKKLLKVNIFRLMIF